MLKNRFGRELSLRMRSNLLVYELTKIMGLLILIAH